MTSNQLEQVFTQIRPTVPPSEASDEGIRKAIRVLPEGPGDGIRALAREFTETRLESAVLDPHPTEQLSTAELLKILTPSVRHIRRRFFDSERPPFRSWRRAVEWLEREVGKETPDAKEAKRRAAVRNDVRPRLDALIERVNSLGGIYYSVHLSCEVLHYLRPGEQWTTSLPASPRSALGHLAVLVRELAGAAGCHPARMLAHVLANTPLHRHPIWTTVSNRSTRLPAGGTIWRRELTLQIHSPHLTDAQWGAIRRRVRETWGVEREKAATARQQTVYEIVHRLGGVPESDVTQFWEKVRREYEASEFGAKSWQAVMRLWRRAQKKLETRPDSDTVKRRKRGKQKRR